MTVLNPVAGESPTTNTTRSGLSDHVTTRTFAPGTALHDEQLNRPELSSHDDHNTENLLTGQRVVQTFDFEERDTNYLELPMYWQKQDNRPGFPHYASGQLDTEHHRSGNHAFKLIPNGGSVLFQYAPRRIRIKQGSDFQVTGHVHFEHTHSCRAQMTCALTDRLGHIIPDTTQQSELIGPDDQGPNGWSRMEVYMPGDHPDAHFITIGLAVLQQEQWNQQKLLDAEIFHPDVRALAWFDDITISQLPRVVLHTNAPGNVFTAKETPALTVDVQGVSLSDYSLNLTINTVNGQLVQQKQWILSGNQGEAKTTTLSLPDIPPGLYTATLNIHAAKKNIATRELTFAKLAPFLGPAGSRGESFGFIVLDENTGDWDTMISMLQRSGIRMLKYPVWRKRPNLPGAIITQPNFDRKLLELQRQHITLVATFSEIPEALSMKMDIGRRSLLDVLSHNPTLWRSEVTYILTQYAQQITQWQVGRDHNNPIWDPRIQKAVNALSAEFARLVTYIDLAAPINVFHDITAEDTGTPFVSIRIPYQIPPTRIADYLDDLTDRGFDTIWVTIDPLPSKQYPRQTQLIDFAKRIAYARKGQADAIFIEHPWTPPRRYSPNTVEPTELYLVYRTLADQIGSANFIGQFDIAPNVPALIFEHGSRGSLIAWTEAPPTENNSKHHHAVNMVLGRNPQQVDLFGNTTPVTNQNGLCSFRLGPWPTIISNINPRLAKLRATLQLSPDYLEASISSDIITLSFENTFNTVISGRFHCRLDQPKTRNWQIKPSNARFALQPGQRFEQTLEIKVPRNEVGGPKQLPLLFYIDADKSYTLNTSIPFDIKLREVDVSTFARRINQRDMLLQVVVTNISESPISLNAFVDLPDSDHFERAIPELAPGLSVTRSFIIPDAADWIGRIIRVGLYDPRGTRRINYHIPIN